MSELSGPERSDATRREFLRRLGAAGVVAAGTVVPGVLAPYASADGASGGITVLTRATVIDATGTPPRRDATVVLVGDRIAAVGPHMPVPAVSGVRVVDLRGKFVIPGLWDMHVHTTVGLESIYLPLYVANGVIGIREMWGFPRHHELREQIAKGELLGPRMVIGSTIVDGDPSWPGVIIVRTEEQARQAVHTTKDEEGADFVKVYSHLTRQTYFAIADEARRLGISFAGHLPGRVSAIEASAAGHRSFEHLYGMYIAASAREAEFLRQLDELPFDPDDPSRYRRQMSELDRQAVSTYDERKAAALFARLARDGAWQSPTLTVLKVFASPAETFENDPRLRYLPAATREYWKQAVRVRAPSTPEQIVAQREFLQARLRLVGAMHRAGVGVLAGTDVSNPYCFPGFSLHDELALLVQSGLTPMRALQSATRDAARYLNLAHRTGTVTAGKSADLLVLDANPLDDIANTTKIHAVVVGGRLIDRAQRERLLADAEAAANTPRMAPAASAACPC